MLVTDNLFGDIVTDLAGAIGGGIGLAASGNVNPEGRFPSMFEPVHGSAPDLAGKAAADPTAAICSAAMMLDHLGQKSSAQKVMKAVTADLAQRTGNTDFANRDFGSRSTVEIGDAIIEHISLQNR